MKFNGTRAWIADNHFENINGNAVLAGYTSEVSGHGDAMSSSAATPSCLRLDADQRLVHLRPRRQHSHPRQPHHRNSRSSDGDPRL